MDKFTTLTGVAAPLPLINVDTDMIIPKQFLKTIKRTGLGKNLFDEMRYRDDGSENPDFVLNKPDYRAANILVAGDNFGCGSSREHAPWALADYGFKVLIAPSFADIFHQNAIKNGLLPIVLDEAIVDRLFELATDSDEPLTIDVDLHNLTLDADGHGTIEIDIDPFHHHCLIHGLDDIGLTLEKEEAITAFEQTRAQQFPWLAAG